MDGKNESHFLLEGLIIPEKRIIQTDTPKKVCSCVRIRFVHSHGTPLDFAFLEILGLAHRASQTNPLRWPYFVTLLTLTEF